MTPAMTPAPSEWVVQWSDWLSQGATVLDVACGSGRHVRFLAARGCQVTAVDRDAVAIEALSRLPGVRAHCADIEAGSWPFAGQTFDAVLVTNYLHRPLFPELMAAVRTGGLLIYETFMAGNERYGRPSNPDFLLRSNELRDVTAGFAELGYFEGAVARPKPAMIQRLCARRSP